MKGVSRLFPASKANYKRQAKPAIFGHRAGFSPSNQLPSFQKAIDSKLDGIETDVRQ